MARKQSRRTVSMNRAMFDAAHAEAARRGVTLAHLVDDALRYVGVQAPPSTHATPSMAAKAVKARKRTKVISGVRVVRRVLEQTRTHREGPIRRALGDVVADMCGEP